MPFVTRRCFFAIGAWIGQSAFSVLPFVVTQKAIPPTPPGGHYRYSDESLTIFARHTGPLLKRIVDTTRLRPWTGSMDPWRLQMRA